MTYSSIIKKKEKKCQVHEKRRGLLGFTTIYFQLMSISDILVRLASRMGGWGGGGGGGNIKKWNNQIMTKIAKGHPEIVVFAKSEEAISFKSKWKADVFNLAANRVTIHCDLSS